MNAPKHVLKQSCNTTHLVCRLLIWSHGFPQQMVFVWLLWNCRSGIFHVYWASFQPCYNWYSKFILGLGNNSRETSLKGLFSSHIVQYEFQSSVCTQKQTIYSQFAAADFCGSNEPIITTYQSFLYFWKVVPLKQGWEFNLDPVFL